MYLIDCRQCRTPHSDRARLCPRCGRMTTYSRSWPDQSRSEDPPIAELGESEWRTRS